MERRTILKILTALGLVGVCLFGMTGIVSTGELARFAPQKTQSTQAAAKATATDAADPTKTKNKTDDDGTDVSLPAFTMPTLYDTDGNAVKGDSSNIVYIHKKGFEVGKTAHENQTVVPTVTSDNMNRVGDIAVRVTPYSRLTYTLTPKTTDAFVARTIAADAPTVRMTDDAWRHGLQTYLSAISDYVRTSGTDVILVIELSYHDATSTVPDYIDLKAFSAKDLGKACSIWVTVHNDDETRPVDYTTGTWTYPDTSTDKKD